MQHVGVVCDTGDTVFCVVVTFIGASLVTSWLLDLSFRSICFTRCFLASESKASPRVSVALLELSISVSRVSENIQVQLQIPHQSMYGT